MDAKIDVTGCPSQIQIFHNEQIPVYLTELHFEKIKFWKNNLRTLLAFELLKDEYGDLDELSLEELTALLAKRSELELIKLAKSIKSNGVRIPLIIKENGDLLDGNRRYFACSLLYHQAKNN